MPTVLAFNPGSNSLKFDVVQIGPGQRFASEGKKLLTGAIDNIGENATAELLRPAPVGDSKTKPEQLVSKNQPTNNFTEATQAAYDLLNEQQLEINLIAIRVVHGANDFTSAVLFDDKVRKQIEDRERLAPLHNANSLLIADAVQQKDANTPIAIAFDTAFHHTIPEHAWRYPLPRDLADKHNIRKFGFHGLSHRYQLERYAQLANRPVDQVSAVTLHLESGSSACAIQNGKSIDTSMGFTPLEGLMMGTRSGSIDPAILPFLMEEEKLSVEDALNILEKKSGLLGISGITLDTRILRQRKEPEAKQAIDIFAYRTRLFVGAYLAALGNAEAVIFSGGIGENTPEVRNHVLEGLSGWGFKVDSQSNQFTMGGDVKISAADSKLTAWVLHAEEGMQLAHECAQISQD